MTKQNVFLRNCLGSDSFMKRNSEKTTSERETKKPLPAGRRHQSKCRWFNAIVTWEELHWSDALKNSLVFDFLDLIRKTAFSSLNNKKFIINFQYPFSGLNFSLCIAKKL